MRVFTAGEKLASIKREISYRKRVYPRLVGDGRMTQAQADEEIALFGQIADDYEALAAKERLL